MRLWSFHPKYLDNVGLSRAINESISGYKALTGKQEMWKNHPQLERFKASNNPMSNFQDYAFVLCRHKFEQWLEQLETIPTETEYEIVMTVTKGQLQYEWKHYLNKLKTQKGRDKELYEKLKLIENPEPHPLFEVVEGDIESWEKVK